jgi:S-adenosylmethionine synthetase
MVDTYRCGKVSGIVLEPAVKEIFPLTSKKGIVEYLQLCRSIYGQTAAYRHFERREKDFTWKDVNKGSELKKAMEI